MRSPALKPPTRRIACLLAAAAIALACAAPQAVQTAIQGADGAQHTAQAEGQGLEAATVVRAVDGDTLLCDVGGTEQRIRLIGIDTPESVHPDESRNTEEGKEASAHVKEILPAGTTVWLQADAEDQDKYGRSLRYVWLEAPNDACSEEEAEAKMLNARLVADGWAEPLTIKPNTKWAGLFARLAG